MEPHEDDLKLANSIWGKEVFTFLTRLYLAEVHKDNPRVAKDLSKFFSLLLVQQKSYKDIVKNDSADNNYIDYQSAYKDWRDGEDALIKAGESIYEDYKSRGDFNGLLALGDSYMKLVSLMYVVKDIARRNLFEIYYERRRGVTSIEDLNEGSRVPGGIWDYLFVNRGESLDERFTPQPYVFKSVREAKKYFDATEFSPVVTMHPTSRLTLKYNKLLLQLDMLMTSNEITGKDPRLFDNVYKEIVKTVADIYGEEMAPLDENKLPQSFKPGEETDIELNVIFQSMYKNMAGLRKTLDDAFWARERLLSKTKQVDKYSPQMRLGMHLNFFPESWAMGDKDGNTNIRAEHLLRSIVLRRQFIVRHYLADLETYGIEIKGAPGGKTWNYFLTEASKRLDKTAEEIESKGQGIDIPLTQDEFNALALDAADAFGGEDVGKLAARFVSGIESAYRNATIKDQDNLILLRDRARSFKFDTAPIGLRDTSEKYSEVLAYLFDDPAYLDLHNEDRHKRIEAVFDDPRKLAALVGRVDDFMLQADALNLREYKKKGDHDGLDNAFIYHTVKRLELAARNPSAFSNMVLAECQQSSDVLTAVLLQKVVEGYVNRDVIDPKQRRGLTLPVVALFEDADTLKYAEKIVRGMLESEAYRKHLLKLSGGDPSQIKLILQIAHSDNGRRSGNPAARAGIYEIHTVIKQVLEEKKGYYANLFFETALQAGEKNENQRAEWLEAFNIKLRYFEGRSWSDSARGGSRMNTSLADLYNQHDIEYSTLQNIDAYYLTPEHSFVRCAMGTLAWNASRLAKMDKEGTRDVLGRDAEIERAYIEAFEGTDPHYKNNILPVVGRLFDFSLGGYNFVNYFSNRGSRNASRNAKKSRPAAVYKESVDVDGTRAIGFNATSRLLNVHPGFLASQYISRELSKTFKRGSRALIQLGSANKDLVHKSNEEIEALMLDEHDRLTPFALKTLYEVSPGFRDAVRFIRKALGATSMKSLFDRIEKGEAEPYIHLDARDLKPLIVNNFMPGMLEGTRLVMGVHGLELPPDILGAYKPDHSIDTDKLTPDLCERMSFLARAMTPNSAGHNTWSKKLTLLPQTIQDRIIRESVGSCDSWLKDDCQTGSFGEFSDKMMKVLDKTVLSIVGAFDIRDWSSDDIPTAAAQRREGAKRPPISVDYKEYFKSGFVSGNYDSVLPRQATRRGNLHNGYRRAKLSYVK